MGLVLLGFVLAACSRSSAEEDASSGSATSDSTETSSTPTADEQSTDNIQPASSTTPSSAVASSNPAITTPPIPWAELPPIEVPADLVPDDYDGRLLAYATVVDTGSGPRLCPLTVDVRGFFDCGFPILGLDWDQIDHEVLDEIYDEARWQHLALLGQWDGTSFTLSDPPFEIDWQLVRKAEPAPAKTPPCPEPAEGWWSDATDVQRMTSADYNNAVDVVNRRSDLQDIFVYELDGPLPPDTFVDLHDTGWFPGVLVVQLVEFRDSDEAELRRQWGGPLCLDSDSGPSQLEMRETSQAVEDRIDEVLPGSGPFATFVEGQVIGVYLPVATTEDQARVDEAFGPDVVKLEPLMWGID